jgi:O-methyltransferase
VNLIRSIMQTHGFQVWMRKRTMFMPLVRVLAGYSHRPYLSTDLRLFRLLYCLERTKHLAEPIAELGIGSGYGMVFTLTALRDRGDKRHYHGFDTFEGFPYIHDEDLKDLPEERKKVSVVGRYSEFGVDHIRRLAASVHMEKRTTLYKGKFEDTLPGLDPALRFSFVYIDCDLYQSYLTALEHIYPRMVPGGIILFDEYEHTVDWPGAQKAIKEFFADKPEKPQPLPFGTSWFLEKGKTAT